jgi:hypothetical protein
VIIFKGNAYLFNCLSETDCWQNSIDPEGLDFVLQSDQQMQGTFVRLFNKNVFESTTLDFPVITDR